MMLTIQKLRDGGFIVSDLNMLNPNRMSDFMFAATTIDEALAYIKAQMMGPLLMPSEVEPGGVFRVPA